MSDTAKPPEKFWDWQSALLVVALMQIAALRLALTEWTPFLSVAQTLGFLGVLLGLVLGYTGLYPRNVRRFALAYGSVLIPAQLLVFVERTDKLYFDLDLIIFRLLNAVEQLVYSQPVYDPLFFVSIVSIGFWSVGVYIGYQLTRHRNFLAVILPGGILMLVVQVYDAQATARAWLLAVYIFATLLLQGRLYFFQNKDRWQSKHVFFTSDAEVDVARVALTFAATVIFIAWTFPTVLGSIAPAARAWSKFTKPLRDNLADAVSALDSQTKNPIIGDFYGAELALGSTAPTSDTPVLYVDVDYVNTRPLRYYWRGRVYDQYVNGRWRHSVPPVIENFDPGDDLLMPADAFTRVEVDFTFTFNTPQQDLLYAPSDIIWTDRPAYLLTNPIDDTAFESLAWLDDNGLSAGESYRIRARIASPTIEDLREAGEIYPRWVTERYLQLPPELEPQLKELALQITAGQDTPYDKAQAITLFLRNEITYVTELSAPLPADQDPLLWVLFEQKEGFCMYSASAEVLLLRSLGIPARMAAGFAQGTYDPLRRRYVVARFDAHAWPEVYFPDIGWVEFEPTGNQDPLNRPRERVAPLAEEEDDLGSVPDEPLDDGASAEQNPPTVSTGGAQFTTVAVLRLLLPLLLIALLALGIFVMQKYAIVDRLPVYLERRYTISGRQPPKWLMRWSQWARLIPIQRAFHAVDVSLRWLGAPQPVHVTPLERAQALAALLPSAQTDIEALKDEHETALFTNRAGNLERARRAAGKIIMETVRTLLQA